MKFSEQWLREWVNPAISSEELVAQVTLAGLEVDEVIPVAGVFSGVVVGKILKAEPHPNADKLQVCTVTDGEQEHQVVCGAPNAREGLVTAFARIGAVLPGDFKIKKAKLRQVESFGMLCSAQELGLSEDHSGIMELSQNAQPGQDVRELLNLNDVTIDVDLTPNRSDCLSIRGLAREVGVLNQCDLTPPAITPVAAGTDATFPIRIEAPQACPRYLGRVMKGINLGVATPQWMQEKLRRSGVRSIDPVVDVTNYVLLELGQPMHAFDMAQLNGGVVVRMAKPEEKLVLLDGSEITLAEDELVIADETKPVALAGIMGGEHSGVNADASDIFLECAFFAPLAIAGRARRHGLHTDASHRYERGVDPELQYLAIERATQLLLDIVGGTAGEVIVAEFPAQLPAREKVRLRADRLAMLLALNLPEAEVTAILERLGTHPNIVEPGVWEVQAPSWRFDMSIEEDLIEEVARIYGYNRIPSRQPSAAMEMPAMPEERVHLSRVRQSLISRGYQEAITFSFTEPKLLASIDPDNKPLPLANALSADLSVMRTTLWAGLLKTVQYNQHRQQPRVRLFETGLRFVPTDVGLVQDKMISGVISGSRHPENWHGKAESVDFFDLKGDIEALLSLSGKRFNFVAATHPALHPGQCARIETAEGELVGFMGRLHPRLKDELDLTSEAYLFELVLDKVLAGRVASFAGISRYPEVRRDIAVLVDESVSYDALRDVAAKSAGEGYKDTLIFDVYRGKGVPEGKKSIALGLTWQHPSRTLTDEETSAAMAQVVSQLETQLSAVLRS
ncbi:phenylalanine--tRNA ligase subunit beta [Pokkaliibacter sp. CJK22405]|uniref:phenylalanine--tRNA ligase subunit beta n=1 Tax=Pokkaliibacter sp. CJK22405 TaxID=3384615 RepID=UPI003984D647